jgi:hypothetical protein
MMSARLQLILMSAFVLLAGGLGCAPEPSCNCPVVQLTIPSGPFADASDAAFWKTVLELSGDGLGTHLPDFVASVMRDVKRLDGPTINNVERKRLHMAYIDFCQSVNAACSVARGEMQEVKYSMLDRRFVTRPMKETTGDEDVPESPSSNEDEKDAK